MIYMISAVVLTVGVITFFMVGPNGVLYLIKS
jgi:hypothetical protein